MSLSLMAPLMARRWRWDARQAANGQANLGRTRDPPSKSLHVVSPAEHGFLKAILQVNMKPGKIAEVWGSANTKTPACKTLEGWRLSQGGERMDHCASPQKLLAIWYRCIRRVAKGGTQKGPIQAYTPPAMTPTSPAAGPPEIGSAGSLRPCRCRTLRSPPFRLADLSQVRSTSSRMGWRLGEFNIQRHVC